MGNVTFIVSDESVNSYGMIILTAGIDTSRFEQNPVMLYMHERATIVGRWENIRKENDKLLADAVFDDSTPLGVQVKNQVEKGFLRAASIGVEIVERKNVNGVDTVTKCILNEISIVDVPSNENALKLYRRNGRNVLCLVENVTDLRASIIDILGLESNISDSEIIAEIRMLKNAPDEATKQVDEAIKNGFIETKSRKDFLMMARITPNAFNSFVDNEEQKRKNAISFALDEAIKNKRVQYQHRCIYERVGEKCGMDTLAKLIAITPKMVRLTQIVGSNRNYDGWTLADFRLYAPDVLKNNPKLYKELLDKEDEVVRGGKTLEWYRKNDPGYLKENPEVYQRLVNKNK